MDTTTLQSIAKYLNDGGDACLIVLLLLPVALAVGLSLTRAGRRGRLVPLTAWLVLPASMVVIGGAGTLYRFWYAARWWGWSDWDGPGTERAMARHVVASALNNLALGLAVASLALGFSAGGSVLARPAKGVPDRVSGQGPRVMVGGLTMVCGVALETQRRGWEPGGVFLIPALAMLWGGAVTVVAGWRAVDVPPGQRLRHIATTAGLAMSSVLAAWGVAWVTVDSAQWHTRLLNADLPLEAWAARALVTLEAAPRWGAAGTLLALGLGASAWVPWLARGVTPEERADLARSAVILLVALGVALVAGSSGGMFRALAAGLPAASAGP